MNGVLFDFERDSSYPLRRIPMSVRFKLDVIGLRFDFAAWAVLSHVERQELVDLPCATDQEKNVYRQRLKAMLAPHADKPETALQEGAINPAPPWGSLMVPAQVVDALVERGVDIPTASQWQGLSELQRFALIKLTRSGHKNVHLQAALQEFGLMTAH